MSLLHGTFLQLRLLLMLCQLCTSLGRTTPWFGKASGNPIHRSPEPGKEAVGIYGTLNKVSARNFTQRGGF